MDETNDEIFREKNTYTKPITKEEKQQPEDMKKTFSLFANDPFITWRMGGESVDEISQMTVPNFHVEEKKTTLGAKNH